MILTDEEVDAEFEKLGMFPCVRGLVFTAETLDAFEAAAHKYHGNGAVEPIPTPAEIKAARSRIGVTQTQAAMLARVPLRVWQRWETGEAPMHTVFWEIFDMKTGLENILDLYREPDSGYTANVPGSLIEDVASTGPDKGLDEPAESSRRNT